MKRRDRLKLEAKDGARRRGHILGYFKHEGDADVATCLACNMKAYVVLHPAPNQIDVSGEVVALNCCLLTQSVMNNGDVKTKKMETL
jgi:uncharacterized protein YrzB (UPF0473 family)